MTQTEFKKFLKNFSKKELTDMILSITKDYPGIRDYFYNHFNKEEKFEFDYDRTLSELQNVDRKVFTKRWMTIGSSEVGKYCRETNKIIRNSINPLIKNENYYIATSLLIETYWLTLENLGISLYKYDSSTSYFNLIEKDFELILEKAQGIERYRIAKLLEERKDKAEDVPLFVFSLDSLYDQFFDNPEWEEAKEPILVDSINNYLKDFDPNRPISNDLSKLVYELLNLKVSQGVTPEKLEEYSNRYEMVGNVYRFRAEKLLEEGKVNEAKEMLDKINNLPTASEEDLEQASLLKIKILRESGEKEELTKELKHNLDSFVQNTYEIYFEYLFNLQPDEQKKTTQNYEDFPTTKNLFLDKSLFEAINKIIYALSTKDYQTVNRWNDNFILNFVPSGTEQVANFYAFLAKEEMKKGTSDSNYRELKRIIKILFDNTYLKPYFYQLKEDLLNQYSKRGKLKTVFEEAEKKSLFDRW